MSLVYTLIQHTTNHCLPLCLILQQLLYSFTSHTHSLTLAGKSANMQVCYLGKKNILTINTDILYSFQKCNFHYWHKDIQVKKRLLHVLSLYAYIAYHLSLPFPHSLSQRSSRSSCASLLSRIKKINKPTNLYINLLSEIK